MKFGRRKEVYIACLLLAIGGIPYIESWTLQRAPSHNRLRSTYSALIAHKDDKGSHGVGSSENSGSKKIEFSRAFCNGVASLSLAAALLLGGPVAHASGVATNDNIIKLSSSSIHVVDAIKTDGPSPPEIKSKSSAKALALSNKLKSLNAKMYGAYWCGHCADQKEALGSPAFENVEYVECSENGKNSQAGGLCAENGIRGYPTWEINGIQYSGERSLDELDKLVEMARASLPTQPKAPPQISSASSDRAKKLSNQLSVHNAALYGAYWDSHTFDQKEILGRDAFSTISIPYIECAKDGENTQIDLCKKKKIRVVPTWEINGELYEGQRSLDDLEKIVELLSSTETSKVAAKSEEATAPKEVTTQAPEKAVSEDKKSKDDNKGTTASDTKSEDKQSQGDDVKDTAALAVKSEDKQSKEDDAKDASALATKSEKAATEKERPGEDSSALAVTSEEKSAKESSKEDEPPKAIATIDKTKIGSFQKDRPAEDKAALETKSDAKPAEEASTLAVKSPPEPPAIMAASSERTLALAKQLEKGNTKFYGGYFCRYCANQKELFGKDAFEKHIQYVECTKDGKDTQFDLCQEKGITSVPVWEIYGKQYSGERDIEELEAIIEAEMTIQAASTESKQAANEENSPPVVALEGKMPSPESASKEKAPPEITSTSSDRALAISKKLEEKNSKLYGAYWCGFTKEQKERLGKEAMSNIRYVECSKDGKQSEIDFCRSKKIQGYSTWEIDGKLFPGEQELDELEDILKEISHQ